MGASRTARRPHAVGVGRAAMQRPDDDRAGVRGAASGAKATTPAKGAVMGVYARGSKLWIRFRDVGGKWRDASTGYNVGQEDLAQATLDEVLARVRQAASPTRETSRVLTVRAFAERWLANRQTDTAADDRGRIGNHILPVLGDIPLAELRPRQVRDFVESLKKKKPQGIRRKDGSVSPTDEVLAPRTIRHIYGTLRAMLNDAVADELIPSSPCVLKDELPAKRDKDRTWRRTAVFTRDEVEMIISAESTPDDRLVLASLMFLGAMRFGEAAALTWRDYDTTCTPLGKLVIEKSYSTKKRKVKSTKTDNPREMPVHPTLARILARWKLSGFAQLMGRLPQPHDPIVPSRRGAYRNANASLRRFHEDLDRIGLRARRQHDARRTFISIARADGAVADTLHFATHGPDGDIMDDYTTMPWPALCAEVAKVRISLRKGKLLEMPMPLAASGASGLAPFAAVPEPSRIAAQSWRSGRDLNPKMAIRNWQSSSDSVVSTLDCTLSVVPSHAL
jgi:integrase